MQQSGAGSGGSRKRIGIFFDEPGFDEYPFSDVDFRTAYGEFIRFLAKRGARVWIIRDPATYAGGNRFKRGWEFRDGAFVVTAEAVDVDIIFNKGHLRADGDANIVNRSEMEEFCNDKWKTYQAFPTLCPRTLLAKDAAEYADALDTFAGFVTVKPVDGWRGLDVRIGEVEEIAESEPTFPCLVQEFVDTSAGIPGIVAGLHDLRMIGVNGDLIYAYVRVPPPHSYVSNYAQGGSWYEVTLDKLPESAVQVFQQVDAIMRKFPVRIYSVDVGLDHSGAWKIFELNSKPSLDPRGSYPGAARFMDAVIALLLAT